MRRRSRTVAATAALLALLAGAPAAAANDDDPLALGDDVPTREPALAWQAPVRCPAGGCAVIATDRVAVVLSPGKPAEVLVVDVRDGSELWRREVSAHLSSAHLVGRLLVLLGPSQAIVLDAATGEPITTIDATITAIARAGSCSPTTATS